VVQAVSRALILGLALGAWGCTAWLGPSEDAEDGPHEDPSDTTQGGDGNDPEPGSGGVPAGGATGGSPSDPSESPEVAPTKFECDPSRELATAPLRRLTQRQYVNTVRDLVLRTFGPSEGDVISSELSGALALIAADERAKFPEDLHGSYRRLDQRVQQAHVDAYFETGAEVAKALTRDSRLTTLLGACADDADSETATACVRSFIERFGALVFRRPLAPDEVDFYFTFYAPSTGIDPAGIADVITGLLNAPHFLYFVEHGQDEAGATNTYELTSYELASRLSYHFWDTMPDQRLSDLAETGELLGEDVYRGEVERLWSDARTHTTIMEFFREWLKLEELPELDRNNDTAVFQNFSGPNLPTPDLRQSAEDEVLALLDYFTWQKPSGMDEIFLTQGVFTRSPELAAIYGSEVWDGSSVPPTFPESRPGILTRAAFLATGTPSTRPIMKGYFIRKNILCDEVPPPPGNAAASPPEFSAEQTTREVVEELTGSGVCAECHQTYLNPLGFALEGFDSLGRARDSELLFDVDGNTRGTRPVDTRSIPQVMLGDTSESDGPDDLMSLVTESGKVEACFARHYFRYSFGRWEGVISDGCVLEELRRALEETGSIADMLKAVALTRAFRTRTFSDAASGEAGQ
jgi:Protein of unknown function (DUF1592)/Protein of unknown function (DUF1588)/Protein of unknown function (DUF1595)/Protein of unknown function (DUF1585)